MLYRSASLFIEQLVPNTFLSRFSNSFLRFCLRETSTGPVRQISDHRFRKWEQLLHDSVTVCHLSAVQPQGLDLQPRSSPDPVHTHHATAVPRRLPNIAPLLCTIPRRLLSHKLFLSVVLSGQHSGAKLGSTLPDAEAAGSTTHRATVDITFFPTSF